MQKIIVDNFGPIKHADIELRDFVVLIGEQASGKSTLGKLVYFFKKFPQVFEFMSAESIMDSSSVGKIHDWQGVNSNFVREAYKTFIQHFGPAEEMHPFKIKFYFSVERDKWVLLESTDKGPVIKGVAIVTQFSDAFIDDFNQRTQKLGESYTSINKSEIEPNKDDSEETRRKKFDRFFNPIAEFAQSLFESTDDTIYFPASRNITVNFSGLFLETFSETIAKRENTFVNRSSWILMKSFLDHISSVNEDFKIHGNFENMVANYTSLKRTFDEGAINIFLQRIEPIIKGKYANNGQGEKIYFRNSQKFVSLENASSGQQESIRILQDIFLIILKKLTASRIIEEPESHLFPTAQKHLLELLVLTVNETSSQMFITTHSPYVLSVLANLLYAKKVSDLKVATAEEIEKKTEINQKTWLDKEKFAAYTMDNGVTKFIFDREKTGLIDQNYLDQISEEIGNEFNVLYNLRVKSLKKN